jgi:hypothetical protein
MSNLSQQNGWEIHGGPIRTKNPGNTHHGGYEQCALWALCTLNPQFHLFLSAISFPGHWRLQGFKANRS